MSLEAGSLKDVTAWAEKEFPQFFSYMGCTPVLETLKFDGEYLNNTIALQPMLITALPVGQMKTGQIVYAHITGSNDVDLFSEEEIVCLTTDKKGKEHFQYMKSVVGLADVKLDVPFIHPIETSHPAAIDRLETLIRYAYLANGEATAVQRKLGFFRTHFRGACRDVARGSGSDVDANEKEDDNTLAGDTTPDLIADTETAGLRDNPAATSIFNEHVHAMDESYYDFKTSVLRQLGAMQSNDRIHIEQLRAQIQELEHNLTVSEQARMKLESELKVEQANAQSASKEAKSWKSQYEGLKETLQGALGQRF